MTPESLARTIAKARHGTDAKVLPVRSLTLPGGKVIRVVRRDILLRALLAQPDGAQEGNRKGGGGIGPY